MKHFFEEEKGDSTHIHQDIIRVIIKQYNFSKIAKTTNQISPFSMQMSVQIPDYFTLVDKNVPNTYISNMGIN